MSLTLEEIKTEILPTLTLEDRRELAKILSDEEAEDAWDRQIEEDAKAGRLDFMAKQADEAYARGEGESWP